MEWTRDVSTPNEKRRMDDRVVGVIGAGQMGSAVAASLMRGGRSVVVLTEGRSPASLARVASLGIPTVASMEALVARAAVGLSIVPPAQAIRAAKAFAGALRAAPRAVTYADWNAVSPETVRTVEETVRAAGADFVDGGIMGPPPRVGSSLPIVAVSGPNTDAMIALREAGLDVRAVGTAVGQASALKMSYAGVTKGLTALYALMQEHAAAHGVGTELDAMFQETRPDLWPYLQRMLAQMEPKAYRWIAEMREISDYTAPDEAGTRIYEGMARFYERVAETVAAKA